MAERTLWLSWNTLVAVEVEWVQLDTRNRSWRRLSSLSTLRWTTSVALSHSSRTERRATPANRRSDGSPKMEFPYSTIHPLRLTLIQLSRSGMTSKTLYAVAHPFQPLFPSLYPLQPLPRRRFLSRQSADMSDRWVHELRLYWRPKGVIRTSNSFTRWMTSIYLCDKFLCIKTCALLVQRCNFLERQR